MSKKGNCPYCGSSNCGLGMSDFFPKKKKKLNNPLKHLSDRPEFKAHLERLEKERKQGNMK